MKRSLLLALVAGLVLLVPAAGAQAAAPVAPPAVAARAWVIENPATGEVLAAKHLRQRVSIASITKLMTVIVALDHARAGDLISVSNGAAAVGGSQAGLYGGQVVTVRDLVGAALVPSANDAALALADGIGHGDRGLFVRWMNEKAQELGMTDSHFVRPDGLDVPGHLSSARDVALLAIAAMKRPLIRHFVAQRAIVIGGRRLLTRDDLLGSFPGLFGVKTGHTDDAGWSQVSAAKRDAVTIYAVILGSPNRGARNRDLATLLRWGLDRYRTVRAIVPDRVYARAAVPYGSDPVDLVAARPIWRVVSADRPLVVRVVAPAALAAPVRRGQAVGEVRVYQGATLVASSPLVATRSVAKPSVGKRLSFYAGRTGHHLWSWVS